MKIFRWIIRIVIFVLVLVLVLDNRHNVQFSFYNIYTVNTPLIVLCFIFLLVGFIVGIIYSFLRSFKLRSRVKLLQKNLDNMHKTQTPIAE